MTPDERLIKYYNRNAAAATALAVGAKTGREKQYWHYVERMWLKRAKEIEHAPSIGETGGEDGEDVRQLDL
jgi:hypothetical protein